MPLIRRLFPRGALLFVVACGSEPGTEPEPEPEPTPAGTLAVALQTTPPPLTSANSVQITGTVTRTPAASDQTVTVTATGGPSAASATASASGSFTLTVSLAANTQTTLTISASDPSGSTSNSLTVTVRHDNVPPQIASMTPASGSDGVTPAAIVIVFSEPVVPGSSNVAVTMYGAGVPGSTALSGDSLTLTFTPSQALATNAAHDVTVTSSRDPVGNTLPPGGGCFVTGGAGIQVFADTGGLYQFGTPSGLVPPDLRELRLGRTPSTLFGMLLFDASRSLDPGAANNTSLWIDLDIDQDGGTGFVPFKDFVFAGVLSPSGAKSEFLIEIGTLVDGRDGVAMYTAQDTAQGTVSATVTADLTATTCGPLLGFAFPFSAIGNDDGAFDLTMYVDVFRNDAPNGSAVIDPVPDAGVFSAALTAAVAAEAPGVLRRVQVEWLVTPRRPGLIRRR